MYEIESKVKSKYHYQQFVNPEMYAKDSSKKSASAVSFTRFVRSLERITGIKISKIDESLLRPRTAGNMVLAKAGSKNHRE